VIAWGRTHAFRDAHLEAALTARSTLPSTGSRSCASSICRAVAALELARQGQAARVLTSVACPVARRLRCAVVIAQLVERDGRRLAADVHERHLAPMATIVPDGLTWGEPLRLALDRRGEHRREIFVGGILVVIVQQMLLACIVSQEPGNLL
jgi:hypothetical protein